MNIHETRAELSALDNKFLNNTSNESSFDGKKEDDGSKKRRKE